MGYGHRQYIASLNGLAGIHVIEEKWAEAAETYRDVLRTMEEYKGKIKTDTLQRLHTVSNLQVVYVGVMNQVESFNESSKGILTRVTKY